LNDKLNRLVDLGHSVIQFRDDGIVQVDFADELLLDVAECKELLSTYNEVLSNKKVPILHVLGKYMNVTKEARDYSATEEGLKFSLAEAYVLKSLAHKILANFYIKFNKPKVPTQFFTTEEDATVWLLTFVK
jgi:Zn-dependent peptidase ImmA (M78 family)